LAELLFWPALIAYGEALVAYAGNARRPGAAGQFATWGVRIGWLAQTALLVVQVARSEGFPWDTWAGALNLFGWLVVSAYLIWGCRARYRLLGLAVMPVVVALLVLARIGGGTDAQGATHESTAFLVLHVVFVLAAFAVFTLAAAISALYLWQERRLKRHEAGRVLGRAPSLVTLERLTVRTVLVALPVLTVGIVAGLLRLSDVDSIDALMGVTLGAWVLYAGFLLLHEVGLRGRRAAWIALGGFALVVLALLPVAHLS
jgi:ABC-type uncharacterized transport system permease subunit